MKSIFNRKDNNKKKIAEGKYNVSLLLGATDNLDWVTIHMGNELHLDSVGLSRAPARYVPIRHRCPLQIHQALVNQITMFYPSLPLVLTLVHCAAYVSSNPMPRINRGNIYEHWLIPCFSIRPSSIINQRSLKSKLLRELNKKPNKTKQNQTKPNKTPLTSF